MEGTPVSGPMEGTVLPPTRHTSGRFATSAYSKTAGAGRSRTPAGAVGALRLASEPGLEMGVGRVLLVGRVAVRHASSRTGRA
eukprot:3900400-Pyramimonas_sp.AAC.1